VRQGDFSYRATRWADDEIGKLTDAFNTMIEALANADAERLEREQIRAQYVYGVITAQEDERKRIARELHDSTSQSLTSLIIGLKTLEDNCQHCRKQNGVVELRSVAGQTLDDVHRLSVQLRPSVLDDLGLPEAIRRHIADYRRRYPLNIDLAITGMDEKRLPPEIETALYRMIQEGLTNIVRHAEAHTVSICIEYSDDKVLVVIEDDGKGFDVTSVRHQDGHLGLYGIQERAELLAGKVEIESQIGQGTSLFIEIPVIAKTAELTEKR
jgi:signal transduction histidine kinase